MSRRLLLLNGLAILAVVCNHAAGWGYTAMFWWTFRYGPVAVPNFDQMGTVPYYLLLVIKQLTMFAVPAFLFVSGFFIAYSARGNSVVTWRVTRVRLTDIVIPYFIWSSAFFVSDFLQGITDSPMGYLERLAIGGATPAYWYIPLICQFYILSPLVIPIAKEKPRLLLVISGLLQMLVVGGQYSTLLGPGIAGLNLLPQIPDWLFVTETFFFVLGLVSGLHWEKFKLWIGRLRRGLFAGVLVFGLLAVFEGEILSRITHQDMLGSLRMLSTSLYAVAFVLCLLAFDQVPIPFSNSISRLGGKSYGIYLMHFLALTFAAKMVYHIAPSILAYQVLFQPLLVTAGLAVPLLFMTVVARSPARRIYRYLFG